ncbi:MAG: FtsX-like permease family protein [Verrucomicrobiota bacterium]|jgi:ABC-type antimicrobial peptide transport system permease subunit|nr:FtsX-like permease family protein [Verrucomicrobiota bacterium]
MILKLVFKSLRHEKMRFATAMFGVAAATGLVVWSLGLTLTAMAQSRAKVRRMTAPFSCWVSTTGAGIAFQRGAPPPPGVPRGGRAPALPPEVVAAVGALPDVAQAAGYHVIRTTLDYRPDGRVMQGPPLMADLALAPAAGCPYTDAKVTGEWPSPDSGEPLVAVCSSVFAPRRLAPPPLGSPLVLITPAGTVTARIGAIIEFPQTVRGFPTAFATEGVMRQAAGGTFDPSPNLLLCQTRGSFKVDALRAAAAGHPAVTVMERREVESQVAGDSLQNFKRQAPLLLTLSVFTTLCMLVNALTVGVEQKLRMLALLRAVGMTARQVMRAVMLEGAVIAGCGWAAGLLGGWAVLALFVRRTPEAFPEGVFMGWQTPVFSGVGVAVVAAVSLFWPCRRAMRIRPLDVLAEHEAERPGGLRAGGLRRVRPWLGFLLLFPMLVLAWPVPVSAMARSVLMLTVGIPLHIAGLLLFLPTFVRAVERFTGPPLAAALGLDPILLRRRISRHLSRTVGMALTLAVGLGAFAAIHIWGASLTKPFIPSLEFPDVIVSILPNGTGRDAAEKVARLDGVDRNRCLAIEAAQFTVSDALTAQVARVTGRLQQSPNVLLFGAEPQAAFGGEAPLAAFRFIAGDRQTAADALDKDDACIITAMFARETGLAIGDTLEIKTPPPNSIRRGPPPPSPNSSLLTPLSSFRIVGIVDLNWHLVTSRAQLRGRNGMSGGTMGPVFVNERIARRLSGNADTTCFLWLNLSAAYRAKGPLPAGQALEADIRQALAMGDANTVRVHHRDEIADGTIAHGAQLIGDMARAPFWSLLVLSTGIITLLIASFQASAQEIAVMRAVGMTRSQLGRMLLGEALMTGFCGIALSLVTGFCIGWTFTGWTRAWMPFGGLPVSLDIPWLVILQGVGFAFTLCVVMSAGPILWLTRKSAQPSAISG